MAAALGGSAGATRVATDAGWTGYERQIGTTGVAVDPDLYVALGVSGAAQHIGGLGAPRHVVSVNTDPSCPMTAMADLGLVTDAGALLAELADRLGVDDAGSGRRRRRERTVAEVARVRRRRRRGRPGRGLGRPGPGPGRTLGRAGRAGTVPGVEERLRRASSTAGCSTTSSPSWWEEVPVERWIVRRSTMMMTGTQSLSVDFRTDAWGAAPYNGMTTLRCHFDAWLAGKATDAGARLVTSTVATGLVRDGSGRVVGVRTDRDGAELHAPVVIACDGVNSFLAKEAGLLARAEASHHTLGVKEVLDLPAGAINERFAVQDHEGVDIEILGCTRDDPRRRLPLHQRRHRSASAWCCPSPSWPRPACGPRSSSPTSRPTRPSPRCCGARPCASTPAHLIPEGGYDTMPDLAADGLLVAGDAGAMTLAAGLWLEGVNFAIGSGFAAGRAADRALGRGDCSAGGLASYRADLGGPVRPRRPQAAAQGPVPGPVRPGPAALPGTPVRPGRGDVHGDQPDPEARWPDAHPASWRPATG